MADRAAAPYTCLATTLAILVSDHGRDDDAILDGFLIHRR
jgi:hypothetical protein